MNLLQMLVKRLPQWGASALKALWRWYWQLGMVGMAIGAAVAAVVLTIALDAVPMPADLRADNKQLVWSLLVLWWLVVILIGVVRPSRRR